MTFAEHAAQRLTGIEPHPQPPLIRLRHPLVLMHGFGLIAGFGRKGHLHDEAMHLRERGVWAFAPNVSPYHTVPGRARQWELHFRHILDETRAGALNLIAHSMGGLDARYLIAEKGWHEHVATLTTVSTPHRGATAADYIMEQPQQVRRWIANAADWLDAQTLDDTPGDFLTAVSELRPDYVRHAFNPATPNHPSVRYGSYAGRAGRGTEVPINPFFRPLNKIIYEREGVNDGYVSVRSARWGTFHGTVDADHARQIGLAAGGLRYASEISAFYRSITQRLADTGF